MNQNKINEMLQIRKKGHGVPANEAAFASELGKTAFLHCDFPGARTYDSYATVFLAGKITGIRQERARRNGKMTGKSFSSTDEQSEHILQEINYILRRNYNTDFLRSVLTRALILEKVQHERAGDRFSNTIR